MPRKYGISTLKYPKNFSGGGSAPSPDPTLLGASGASPRLGRLQRYTCTPPNCNTWIRLWTDKQWTTYRRRWQQLCPLPRA